MTRKKTISLVVLGMVIGSIVTGILFTLLLDHRPDTEEMAEDAGHDDLQSEPPGYSPKAPKPFTRNIKGTCAFSGTVLDQQGNAIADAMVRLRLLDQPWSAPDPPIETRTDKDGNFHITGVNEKLDFQLWVWAPTYSVASHNNLPCGSHTSLALDKSSTLDLLFTNPKGDPVGPVKVQLIGSDLWPAREGYTSSDGKLTIHGLKPGEYSIWADTKKTAFLSLDPIQLEPNKEKKTHLVLTPSRSAKIVVVNKSKGTPLAGATVLVGPSSTYLMHKVATTGEDGTAVISSLPERNYTATVMAKGFRTSVPIPVRLDQDNLIALDTGAALTGTVRTAEGSPISNAFLEVKKGLGKSFVRHPSGRGEGLRLRILDAARSGWPALYEIRAGHHVSGPINIPVPVESATGISIGKPHSTGEQTTDQDGRFRMDGLPFGNIAIRAHHQDFVMADQVQLILEHGKSHPNLDIVMRRGTILSVRTLNARGFPIAGAEVDIYNGDQDRIATATGDAKGVAHFTGLPGIFRIEATAPQHVPAVKNIRVRTGTENDVALTLPAADKRLNGRVLDHAGYGIRNATITARAITKGLLHALTCLTESDGTFVLEGVGSGGYHVTADAGELGRAQVPDAYFDTTIKLVLGTGNSMVKPTSMSSGTAKGRFDFDPQPDPFSGEEGDRELDRDDDSPNIGIVEDESPNAVHTQFGKAEMLPVTGAPPGKGSLPLSIGGSPGKIVVTRISPGSRVALAGLSKGDRIVAINNRKMSGPAAARRAIEGPIGSVVTMTIENKGERFTIIVQRVRVK